MYSSLIAALTAINLQSYFLTTWNDVLGTGYTSKKIGRSIADSFFCESIGIGIIDTFSTQYWYW